MTIKKIQEGSQLTVILEGRLDAMTARQLEAELKYSLTDVTKLVINMEKLDYLASAGIRVLTAVHRIMKKQGEMILRNPNEVIREIFEVTGLEDIFHIEG